MKYIPDTNVWSRFMRERDEDRLLCQRLEEHLGDCYLSTIVLMELEYGAEKRGHSRVSATD
ncbi:MAG: PIN domain-containing protein [Puniceicoccales bacterium]|nr:PIN domain-containing protein [Puniceicoccales bacterium]